MKGLVAWQYFVIYNNIHTRARAHTHIHTHIHTHTYTHHIYINKIFLYLMEDP